MPSFRPPPRLSSGSLVVTLLICLNVACLIAQMFSPDELSRFFLHPDFIRRGAWWQLVTHMFMHAGLLHLLCNMMALHFLGRAVAQVVGPWHFLALYFLGGIAGGLLQIGFGTWWLHDSAPLLGASGAVFAALTAFATLMPEQRLIGLILFIPVQAKARTFAISIMAASAVLAFIPYSLLPINIGHLAHFGGGLAGWLYIQWFIAGQPQPPPLPRRGAPFSPDANRPVFANALHLAAAPPLPSPKASPLLAPQVEAILDKISRSGLDSLTPQERSILVEGMPHLRR